MKKQLYSTVRLVILSAYIITGFSAHAQSGKAIRIVSGQTKATICIDKTETAVVHKAAQLFQSDVFAITGQQLSIQQQFTTKGTTIVAGTLGQSKLLTQLIRKYKLNTDSVLDRWEAFSIQTVTSGSNTIIVVMGSNRRGTAYGILELSRMIGISPWVWWADLPPTKKSELSLEISKPIYQQPSVQYRGIFLNDEDW